MYHLSLSSSISTLQSVPYNYIPRYWAVAVPAYLCMAVGVFLCLYLAANFLLVPALEDPRTVTGELNHLTLAIV